MKPAVHGSRHVYDMNKRTRGFHVLGIESSCDDTGVAIVREDGKILSNCINTQLRQHVTFGGIIPMLAKEYHVNNIDNVAKQAFRESGLRSVGEDIDAIAVSTKPGLAYSLQVGLNYARTLAKKHSKPLIPIHHMQAHALMPLLEHKSKIRFPYIALLISGGHCILSIVERYNKFSMIGNTVDDAPGELLDKVARRVRLKNLGDPFDHISGGAAIELLSQSGNFNKYKYFNDDRSIPMLTWRNCDFSFSGYRGTLEKIYPMVDDLWATGDREGLMEELGDLCSSLQRGILIQLCKKLQRAFQYYRMHWRHANNNAFSTQGNQSSHLGFNLNRIDQEPDLVVSGGCAANKYLIQGLKAFCRSELDQNISLFCPSKALCNDNGLMIAWNGMLRLMDLKERLESAGGSIEQAESFCDSLDDSVIADQTKMDSVEVKADSAIGEDLTLDLSAKSIVTSQFRDPELRLRRK